MMKIKIIMTTLYCCAMCYLSIGCSSSRQFGDDRRVVKGSIGIEKRYFSDSVARGKTRLQIHAFDKYIGKEADVFVISISGKAIKRTIQKIHHGSSMFEIDLPHGEYEISVWITIKSEAQTLSNLIVKSGEVIVIKAEIGGVGIY